jgi:two-component system, NarL family, nitrate/nitrite response regulator NarL
MAAQSREIGTLQVSKLITLTIYTSEPLHSIALDVVLRPLEDISLLPVVSDIADLLPQVVLSKPQVILLAVDTKVDWGLLNQLRRESPDSKVVLWLLDITPELAYQAIEYGVRGILRKNLAPEMIVKCVRKVHAGELWLENALTQTFLSGRAIKVSKREGELIKLVSQGLKNKEIATVMGVTEGTVKVYLSRLFGKIGARDRFELALIGLRNAPSGMDFGSSQIHTLTDFSAGPEEPVEAVPKKGQAQSTRLFFARVAH